MKKVIFAFTLVWCLHNVVAQADPLIRTRLTNGNTFSFNLSSPAANPLYSLDLNGDGSIDAYFNFTSNGTAWSLTIDPANANTNFATQASPNDSYVNPFYEGNVIGSTITGWSQASSVIGNNVNNNLISGYDRFIAIILTNGATANYGWIRLNATLTNNTISLVFKDYGYMQTAGQNISTTPDDSYLNNVDINNNWDFILNQIQAPNAPATLTDAMTMNYNQNRYQDENFIYQYAISNTKNAFSGYIRLLPDNGAALQLNNILLPSGILLVDQNGNALLNTPSFTNGSAYYLKITNFPANSIIS
ncbi:MAG TPA: hypothetical protein VNW06_10755, partial [Cytophagaceae bacterium]|nr:hypothetical protein [Cytophagaceae bacterium]